MYSGMSLVASSRHLKNLFFFGAFVKLGVHFSREFDDMLSSSVLGVSEGIRSGRGVDEFTGGLKKLHTADLNNLEELI